jgi:hypothetical protein
VGGIYSHDVDLDHFFVTSGCQSSVVEFGGAERLDEFSGALFT